jgi:hypothetical protein
VPDGVPPFGSTTLLQWFCNGFVMISGQIGGHTGVDGGPDGGADGGGRGARREQMGADGQGCHADVFGRTDDRMMAVGASMTWTHCSILFEVTWGKTAASARTRTSARTDGQRPGHGCQGTI